MSTTTPSLSPATTPDAAPAANPDAAVRRCLDAWDRAARSERAEHDIEYLIHKVAGEAYRIAMPDLTTPENIRAFVACVSRGILRGAIDEKKAAKLLYAVQVACGALRHETKPEARQPKPAQSQAA